MSTLEKGQVINLKGYTSTSKDFSIALKFSLSDLKEGQMSVVYHIDFHKDKGLFDMEGFSCYNQEKEVLVQDVLDYSITDIEKKNDNGTPYYKIFLRHPP